MKLPLLKINKISIEFLIHEITSLTVFSCKERFDYALAAVVNVEYKTTIHVDRMAVSVFPYDKQFFFPP